MYPPFFSRFAQGPGHLYSETVERFTNKEFLLKRQEQIWKGIKGGMGFGTTYTPGHRPMESRVKLSSEKRVDIKTLTENIDTPMTGNFFLCRCISHPHKMTSVMTVVDDPEGQLAVLLALYNYTFATSNEHIEMLLPVGLVLAIKNPWLKSTMDGGLTVRCDNPSDVVVVGEEAMARLFPELTFKADIPIPNSFEAIKSIKATDVPLPKTTAVRSANVTSKRNKDDEALRLRNLGNMSFGQKEFMDAIRFYNQGLEILPKNVDLLSNRAAAFISMGCYKKALLDTRMVLDINPFHMKGIFRQVKALWGLNRYKNALNFLSRKMAERKDLRKSKELISLKNSTEKLLKQHETGDMDIVEFMKHQREPNPTPLELAEFTGPVKVANISGKGRGLIATADIKAGQLILISHAFAHYAVPNGGKIPFKLSLNSETKSLTTPEHDAVVTKIAQKLTLDPKLGREVYQLFAGPRMGSLEADDQANEEIDMKRIDRIVAFNAFSHIDNPSRTSKNADETDLFETKATGLGLWVLPSFINHSCSGANCDRNIDEELMIIRAMKPIKIEEEILILYTCPTETYEERRRVFTSHDFDCNCLRCNLDKEEDESVRRRRSEILEFFRTATTATDPAKLMKAISTLESLQAKNPRMNLSLASPVVADIGLNFAEIGKFEECRQILEKVHFVTEGTVLGRSAAMTSANILASCLRQTPTPFLHALAAKWLDQFKRDLLIAYGSLKAAFVIAPYLMKILESIGIPVQDIFD